MEEICACQEVHSLSTKKVEVCYDALNLLAKFINSSPHKSVLIIFDKDHPPQKLKNLISKNVTFKEGI